MNKTTVQIQTNPYELIGYEFEGILEPEAAVKHFNELKLAYTGGDGLTAKELDLIIEKMCLGVTVEGGTDMWARATQAQKDQINCLKRALSRIKAKQSKKNDEEEESENIGPMDGGVDNWGR